MQRGIDAGQFLKDDRLLVTQLGLRGPEVGNRGLDVGLVLGAAVGRIALVVFEGRHSAVHRAGVLVDAGDLRRPYC